MSPFIQQLQSNVPLEWGVCRISINYRLLIKNLALIIIIAISYWIIWKRVFTFLNYDVMKRFIMLCCGFTFQEIIH